MESTSSEHMQAQPRSYRKLIVISIIAAVMLPVLPPFASAGMAMFTQAVFFKPYQFPSGSMIPTIQINDRIVSNRFVYHFRPIERGDIILFTPPGSDSSSAPYVKRVIGLPGDTVEIKGGRILVNGQEFLVEGASAPSYESFQIIPEGRLFVLGDNRNESSDSHIWGTVPEENVIGRVDMIYWPPSHMKFLNSSAKLIQSDISS